MNKKYRKGAIGALLDEYEKAIIELQDVIQNISETDLKTVVDNVTADPNCKSIQTVLAHVVSSGYSYNIYIQSLKDKLALRPGIVLRLSVAEYQKDLDKVFQFTCDTFADITDNELEEFDNDKKIKTHWKQFYDIEQIMEHAIVHILRHRRQIEKFKTALKS
jgi:hypothetical protein